MRVLVVEDQMALRRQVAAALAAEGYAVDEAADGTDGEFRGATEPYDAVVLDLGLPGRDGLSVLRAWRAGGRAMPVLILSARGVWHERVEGIDAGADDYLVKPFRMEELLARVRALIRRSAGHAAAELTCGTVTLDTRSGRVTANGAPVTLTAHEYRVLAYLMMHRNRVVSRSELTEHVYAQDFDRDSNTIEVFVARLRKKLGTEVIRTVRGLGYTVGSEAA
ncbi:response regulator transcription factor [Azospirillum sp. RWY-5-1]|uniref:Response regulator transcription factor n=1 Tax=Azospirillum oleiclasticum TaxID=2735135 RepID=A0ABX2T7V8_9PROT|nr:response regulator transcription factor [Azospirillum oleiclasticum]NYZ12138.1 response regulator transcription factor [Azospirillum oleiclasticum]NYZ19298.1 response regulator transcription factor [Azospirillum oleiclasticum]